MSGIGETPGIEKISGSLKGLLQEKEIIARCELLLRIYDSVRAASLSGPEKEELERLAGKPVAAGIFASMMKGEPIFNDLPRLDTYTQMNGRIFHLLHTRKFSRQDFDDARRRLQDSIPELRAVLRQSLTDLLKQFMKDAGYRCVAGEGKLIFEASERRLEALVFTSIKSVDAENILQSGQQPDRVILVPSSESLEPFMQFFRMNGRAIEEAGLGVWVANIEKGTIDPFIGYTTDLDIYGQFSNPRLAEMVRSNWSKMQ